jgi:glycosyltransferase involved in cell wall biosynthesis
VSSILFVHNGPLGFIQLDLEQLRKRYQVTECCLRSRWVNPASVWRQVKNHDLVFGWFASWHTFLPLLFAKILGKSSVLVIGGYDLANMPEIGYGHQRGGLKKWISRLTMRLATRLVTNSYYSQDEAVRNTGITRDRVRVVYHGLPDPFGPLPEARARMALTVGKVDRSNLSRKGHEPFVRTAALLPDVNFVLVGAWEDDAVDHLRAIATPNVTFSGKVSAEALCDYYRQAAVYVQASRHEGFGLSVAEAMLAGCIPVITQVGALPEVVGEYGIYISAPRPDVIAQAIEEAFAWPAEKRASVRQHILEQFPMEKRGQLLEQLIRPLLNESLDHATEREYEVEVSPSRPSE